MSMYHYLLITNGVTGFTNKKAALAAYEEEANYVGQDAWLIQGNFAPSNYKSLTETLYVPHGPIWVLKVNKFVVDVDRVRNAFMAQGMKIGIYFDLRPLHGVTLMNLDVRIRSPKGYEIVTPWNSIWLGQITEDEAVALYNDREDPCRNDQLRHLDGYGDWSNVRHD